jgi:aspartyl aminopeptidase
LDERAGWDGLAGGAFVVRGGALVAWWSEPAPGRSPGTSPRLRIVGAHTDSPNLRLKPHPDTGRAGFRQLGVEVYGGALRNSWLDRDLGLSGRLVVRGGDGAHDVVLVRTDDPVLRVPQLAIHLDREVTTAGLQLNPQQHLVPVWGLGDAREGDLLRFLADLAGVAPGDVAGWDVMAHDTAPAAVVGADASMVASARLDDQLSCWAGTRALLRTADLGTEPGTVAVLALFDHEEVGSRSATGAGSSMLAGLLRRFADAAGWAPGELDRALADSLCASADGAHATHPNYADRHEPAHHIALDGGPVLKHNANVRYATDAPGAAELRRCAALVGVPLQDYVVRTDMACGSTIGPDTAAALGVTTVDLGVAQLAMHSARETCGRRDAERFVPLLAAFLRG